MRNKGWVKLYRAQFTHWISKKPWCDGYAWAYFYSQANHKPGMVNLRNEYIEVKRGQFVTSKIKLMELFGWTRTHLKNFLKSLKKEKMITYRTTYRFTVVTVVKYEAYQGSDTISDKQNDKQIDQPVSSSRPAVVHKQECIKNDLRMIKKISDVQHEKNKENITKARKQFLEIAKKGKGGNK